MERRPFILMLVLPVATALSIVTWILIRDGEGFALPAILWAISLVCLLLLALLTLWMKRAAATGPVGWGKTVFMVFVCLLAIIALHLLIDSFIRWLFS